MWAPMQAGWCLSKEDIWTERNTEDAGAQKTDLGLLSVSLSVGPRT